MIKPLGIFREPFEFLAAFIMFFSGLYGFLDPDWPPDIGPLAIILVIQDAYLLGSGLAIMIALIILQKYPSGGITDIKAARALLVEKLGWMFVGCTTLSIAMSSWILPPSAIKTDDLTPELVVLWTILWIMMSIAAFAKWAVLRKFLKRGS